MDESKKWDEAYRLHREITKRTAEHTAAEIRKVYLDFVKKHGAPPFHTHFSKWLDAYKPQLPQ